jgi:DNA-binding NtrC family response regulator
VSIPPLRARKEDILEILLHALGSPGSPAPPNRRQRLSPDLVEALLLYSYPFNVRELLAVAAQLQLEGAGAAELDLELVASRLRTIPPPRGAGETAPDGATLDGSGQEHDDHEPPPDRRRLEELLREHQGVVADVARAVRRSRKQVYRWIRHHDIDPRSFRA